MKKNKVILFDWGNIVENHKTGYTLFKAYDDLFKEIGYKGKNVFEDLGKYHLTTVKNLSDFERIYYQIKNDMNLKVDFNEFLNIYKKYCDKIDFYQDVRDYELSLKNKCFIGVFSNLYLIDEERIDYQLGLNNYDYKFLSYELETKKPDINCFKKVDDMLPFEKSDILFIDDRESNVLAAKEIGWNACCLDGTQLTEIKKQCAKFLED